MFRYLIAGRAARVGGLCDRSHLPDAGAKGGSRLADAREAAQRTFVEPGKAGRLLPVL